MVGLNEAIGGKDHWTMDMQNFRGCIASAGLGHIKTIGSLFTWTNKRPLNLIQERLDRLLKNEDLFLNFTEGIVHVKLKGLIDRCPLLLHVPMKVEKLPKQF